MASNNEIIVRIAVDCAAFASGFITPILACKFALARSAAAHKREVAELRECLKEAVREKCPFTRMSCKHGEPCDYECGTEKWRKALELRDFADAIAADLNDCGHTSVTYGFDDLLPIIQCLRQAAEMQERCEKVIARCNAAKDMNSPTWTFDKQVFAMDLYEIVNYIIRGDAGKEEK